MKKIKPIILVGGKSRRLGQDKLYLEFNGNLVIKRTYFILKEVFDEEPLFVGREALSFTSNVVPDKIPGLGPIGGLFTAFDCVHANFVFLTACDMPLISKSVLRFMLAHLNPRSQIYLPKFKNGMIEPLFAFYSTELKNLVNLEILSGELKLRSLISGSRVQYLNENEIKSVDEELLSFLNINTKDDLDRILYKAGYERSRNR